MDGSTCVADKAVALRCPVCRVPRPSYVKDSRPTSNGMLRRRRLCTVCNTRFSTIERVVGDRQRAPYDHYTEDDWELTG